MGLRISESVKIGPFRIRASAPLNGRGRARVSAGVRVGRRGWVSVSEPVSNQKRRRSR